MERLYSYQNNNFFAPLIWALVMAWLAIAATLVERDAMNLLNSDHSDQIFGEPMQTWQMQNAKAHFSDLVRSAKQDGPQDITVHGKSVAVVVSRELFDRLSGNDQSLVAFMQRSPLYGCDDIVFERDQSLPREIAL